VSELVDDQLKNGDRRESYTLCQLPDGAENIHIFPLRIYRPKIKRAKIYTVEWKKGEDRNQIG